MKSSQQYFFSVLADEATDIINIEQMSIVLRFVNQASLACKGFLCFFACDEGLPGGAIARKVLTAVINLGLDMSMVKVMMGHQICLRNVMELRRSFNSNIHKQVMFTANLMF